MLMLIYSFFIHFVSSFSDVIPFIFFFFKQKTAYEIRISVWSSDVCSSDLFFGGYGRYALATRLGDGIDRFPRWLRGLAGHGLTGQIGRASCRERVCKSVLISVVAESL